MAGVAMMFDRFDICAAWYHYLSETHEGQWSAKYARLSRLMSFYSPCESEQHLNRLNPNAYAIYSALMVREFGETT